jgi:alkaline phosphatase
MSTAYIVDATPAAMCAHTHGRSKYAQIVTESLESAELINSAFKWPKSCKSPAAIFGGGGRSRL